MRWWLGVRLRPCCENPPAFSVEVDSAPMWLRPLAREGRPGRPDRRRGRLPPVRALQALQQPHEVVVDLRIDDWPAHLAVRDGFARTEPALSVHQVCAAACARAVRARNAVDEHRGARGGCGVDEVEQRREEREDGRFQRATGRATEVVPEEVDPVEAEVYDARALEVIGKVGRAVHDVCNAGLLERAAALARVDVADKHSPAGRVVAPDLVQVPKILRVRPYVRTERTDWLLVHPRFQEVPLLGDQLRVGWLDALMLMDHQARRLDEFFIVVVVEAHVP